MFDADFDTGFDMDYSYLDDEDFGLAKSFSKAPWSIISPAISLE
jgi:20S proteasome subunit beta 5